MDAFATKGMLYLLAIGYLLSLVTFYWLFLRRGERRLARAARAPLPRRRDEGQAWFEVPEGFYFHRGHTWALPESDDVFRVGMADFAQKFLGKPESVYLPGKGQNLEQGQPGWAVQAHGERLDLLSPLSGEVVETNPELTSNPGAVSEDPYGRGWLLKVRSPRPKANLSNLLPAELARAWTGQAFARLRGLMGADLGVVLQDGGVPVSGFARELAGERWREVAAKVLLTS